MIIKEKISVMINVEWKTTSVALVKLLPKNLARYLTFRLRGFFNMLSKLEKSG